MVLKWIYIFSIYNLLAFVLIHTRLQTLTRLDDSFKTDSFLIFTDFAFTVWKFLFQFFPVYLHIFYWGLLKHSLFKIINFLLIIFK